ncbi:FadR family transcriptional regulator [Deinococcus sp. KSM4-11]|uniref:FadR/GntR family transcriptional regulator n=1 Tax=Deinococcus sp. KSM4-11 TaxID=2568654 RepID=UPI0010A310F3|nr:FadR/GntR family transcriptional regulator [Deinococcus sp. KSM4-11]THF87008.1 FadR family transcriptional regulator [Deinococcus sp. KSM4-11]
MTVQPVKRQKLTESVAEELLSLIVRGGFPPGHRLPAERVLAEQMGVSRASVRDAVARLEALGHVGVRQGDGIYVLAPSAATLSQPFRGLLTRLPQTARDLLEFRRMLEPEVAALAAQRVTDTQEDDLWISVDAQVGAARRGIKLVAEDLHFHALIARIAGNGVVTLVLDTLQELLHDLRQRDLPGDLPDLTIRDHRAVVQAIASRDPVAAHAAMAAHLDTVIQTASAALSFSPDGGSAHD